MSSTLISWGLTVSLVGVAVYIYRPDLLSRLGKSSTENKIPLVDSTPKTSGKKTKSKKPAGNKSAGSEVGNVEEKPSDDSQKNKKRKIVSPAADNAVAAKPSEAQQKEPSRADEGSLDDKDFAKQLAKTQAGTSLRDSQKQPPSKNQRRASRLAAAGAPEPSEVSTEASSTTGRDADDDLTPAESPETKPVAVQASQAGDVSDMLEASGPKPTTLRLTDVSNQPKQKKQPAKAFEQVMSKKKRNEQARKEELRILREESDRVHEAKKQEQLRKARMAAGTSNQTKANNFAAQTNAWKSGPSDTVKEAPATSTEPLLDTFEPALAAKGSTDGAVHVESTAAGSANQLRDQAGENAAAAITASSREGPTPAQRQQYANQLSEEDQIKLLQEQEQEDAWESVTNKKSKKKGKHESEKTSVTSSPSRAPTVPTKTTVNGTQANGVQKKVEGSNRFNSIQDTLKVDDGLLDAEWEA